MPWTEYDRAQRPNSSLFAEDDSFFVRRPQSFADLGRTRFARKIAKAAQPKSFVGLLETMKRNILLVANGDTPILASTVSRSTAGESIANLSQGASHGGE